MKIGYKKLIYVITFYYPLISMITTTIDGSLSRLSALIYTVILMCYTCFCALKHKENQKLNCIVVVTIGILMIICISRDGLSQLFHSDFYAFILLILIFNTFLQESIRHYFIKNIYNLRGYKVQIIIFYLLLLFSVVFKDGVSTSSGILELKGPYEYPHALAYSQIVVYSLSSLYLRKYKAKYFIFVMILSFACIVLTGVRSALLAIIILIFADYNSVRSLKKRTLVFFGIAIVILFLFFNTNILTNNPIVQKSILASQQLTGITNGRSFFDKYLMMIFYESSVTQKIIGIGLPNVRRLMLLRFGGSIHAHNDFINSLLGFGIIGLLLFSLEFFGFCRKNHGGLFLFGILFVLIWSNGLYMYHSFTPCLFCVAAFLDIMYSKNRQERIKIRRNSNV